MNYAGAQADVVLWDFDGTLVNSAPKNLATTIEVLTEVVPHLVSPDLPRWLTNEDEYHLANHRAANWRELYIDYYGLTLEETDAAGALWWKYQASNRTPVTVFEGITETVTALADRPQGICSQNSTQNIVEVLEEADVAQHFHSVVGYDQVPFEHSKPEPYGGLKCLARMFSRLENMTIYYIGDHEGDVIFTRNIAGQVCSSNRLVSIAVGYSGARPQDWENQPDHIIQDPREVIDLVNS